MSLLEEEIVLLKELMKLSGETWFDIRTPTFIWDSDNKVRLNVREAVKEFLQCTRNRINDLSDDMRFTARRLFEKLFEESECCFDKFDYFIDGFSFD